MSPNQETQAVEKIYLPRTSESETLKKIRHTASHIMAMAVQKLFPKAQVTIGPWIETDLDCSQTIVTAKVNGRERQNYPVSDMFFSPQELVAKLSRCMTLEAGDIISCGTSLGAMPWQNDAVVEVAIEGIGTLSNTMKESA
jgi:2-keto-4-pentenoate hydratase/2-oxohepta-3-ene-1,7-dioic acid hydratase in catechol pathway